MKIVNKKAATSLLKVFALVASIGIVVLGMLMFSREYVRQNLQVEYDSVTEMTTKYRLEEDAFAEDTNIASDVIANHKLPRMQWDEYFDAVQQGQNTHLLNADEGGKGVIASVQELANGESVAPVSDEVSLSSNNTKGFGSPQFQRESRKAVGANKTSTSESEDDFNTQKAIGNNNMALQLKGAKGNNNVLKVSATRNFLTRADDSKFIISGEKIKINRFYVSPPPSLGVINDLATLNNLRVVLDKNKYLRHHFIRVNLVAPQSINLSDLNVSLYYNGELLSNFGYFNDAKFVYEEETIYATLFAGMNPPLGSYEVRVTSKIYLDWAGVSAPFTLNRRAIDPIPKGFSVVNYESVANVSSSRVLGTNGLMGGHENLIDWVKYMDNDAFWVLAAQTTGWAAKKSFSGPWIANGIENLDRLGPVARKKGIALGAYFMSFYTPKNGKEFFKYAPSLGYNSETGEMEDSFFISLSDERRIGHITDLAKKLQNNKYIDYIGFDFIRTGRADGYENGPFIVRDMNIKTPLGYKDFTRKEKIRWFAALVESRRDNSVLVKWRMWRAQRVASIVGQVIKDAGVTKPVWVFTLGWDHGYEHGQDPYMFFDAGVTIDSVMLYEASSMQFKHMMVQWPNYMSDNLNNMMVGNATDIRLLDGNNRIDLEYLRRTGLGSKKVYQKGMAKGIFVHDLSRALWSKWKTLSVKEWAIVHGASTSQYRSDLGLIPYHGEIKTIRPGYAEIIIKNNWHSAIENVRLKPAGTISWERINDNIPNSFRLEPNETKKFYVQYKASSYQKKINLLGYYLDSDAYRRYFFYKNQRGNKTIQTAKETEEVEVEEIKAEEAKTEETTVEEIKGEEATVEIYEAIF